MSVWFLFYGWEIHVTTSFDFSTQYYQPEALCILPAVLNVRKRVYFFTIMYPMTVVELICSGYRSTVFSEVQCLSSLCWRTTRWSYLSLRCRCQFYFPCIAVCKLLIYDLLSLFLPPPSIRRLWILNLCILGVFHLDPVSYERSERSLIFISISYNRQFLSSQKIWPVSSIISL